MSMKVKAIEVGFYGNKRRKPNEKSQIFTLNQVSEFSSSWMRVVSATAAEKEELKKVLEKRQAELNDPKPKRIIVAEHLVAKSGVDVADEEQFDELFEEGSGKEEELAEKKAEKKAKASKKKPAPSEPSEPASAPVSSEEEEAL
jgi:hypothetical protein